MEWGSLHLSRFRCRRFTLWSLPLNRHQLRQGVEKLNPSQRDVEWILRRSYSSKLLVDSVYYLLLRFSVRCDWFKCTKKSNTPSPPQLKQVLLYLWTVVGVSVHVVAVLEITCTWKYWIFDSLSGCKWQWRSLLLSMRWRIAINYITEHQIPIFRWPSFKMQLTCLVKWAESHCVAFKSFWRDICSHLRPLRIILKRQVIIWVQVGKDFRVTAPMQEAFQKWGCLLVRWSKA